MKRRRFFVLPVIFLLFVLSNCLAQQDIQFTILLETEQIQSQEKQIFTDMKNSITMFMNNRRWTLDKYSPQERIKATIAIRLQSMPVLGSFTGSVQIQASRPVHNSSYESILINYLDKDLSFDYSRNQSMDYSDNTFTTNLTSLMAFYAYIILAYDYDSFSRLGGTPYIEKLQQVVNNAQQAGYPGWTAFDANPNNRYWLFENLNNPQFLPFREGSYGYYRMGLDEIQNKPDQCRTKVLDMLTALKKVHDIKPNSCLIRTYFNTKAEEIPNILSESSSQDKAKALDMLKDMDPTNAEKYEKALQGG